MVFAYTSLIVQALLQSHFQATCLGLAKVVDNFLRIVRPSRETVTCPSSSTVPVLHRDGTMVLQVSQKPDR